MAQFKTQKFTFFAPRTVFFLKNLIQTATLDTIVQFSTSRVNVVLT